ncbi:MAG: hypothetical protein RJA24_1401 [Pseudomonadota bacterium]|jgi:hypothetical protein
MFKRNLAVTLTAVLLSAAGAAQAATSSFPSAAEEGSGVSINSPLPAAGSNVGGAGPGFPSAASEGGETSGQTAAYTTPRNLESSYAGGHGGVFPGSAME